MAVLGALGGAVLAAIRYLLYCCCGITYGGDIDEDQHEVERSPERQRLVLHSTVSIQYSHRDMPLRAPVNLCRSLERAETPFSQSTLAASPAIKGADDDAAGCADSPRSVDVRPVAVEQRSREIPASVAAILQEADR